MKYTIKRVLECDYRPQDGEPFAVTESGHGYIIWCRTPMLEVDPFLEMMVGKKNA